MRPPLESLRSKPSGSHILDSIKPNTEKHLLEVKEINLTLRRFEVLLAFF